MSIVVVDTQLRKSGWQGYSVNGEQPFGAKIRDTQLRLNGKDPYFCRTESSQDSMCPMAKINKFWNYYWIAAAGEEPETEFAHDAKYWLFSDGRFYDSQKDSSGRLKSGLLENSQLDANAKAAKAKLQAAINEFAWPRDAYLVRQYQEGIE